MAFSAPVRLKQTTIDATNQATIGGSGQTAITGAAVGDLVFGIVGFGLATNATLTVTDSKSNSWTSELVRADKGTGNTPHCIIFYSVLTVALVSGVDYLTGTFGTNVNYPLLAYYKSTPTASTTVATDQTNTSTGSSGTPSAGNITTVGSDDLVVMGLCMGVNQTFTQGTGFTILDSLFPSNSTKGLAGEYRIEAAPGTFTGNGTCTSTEWAACIAGFKATASGGVTAGSLGLLGVG